MTSAGSVAVFMIAVGDLLLKATGWHKCDLELVVAVALEIRLVNGQTAIRPVPETAGF